MLHDLAMLSGASEGRYQAAPRSAAVLSRTGLDLIGVSFGWADTTRAARGY